MTMADTALAAAFERQGVYTRDAEFTIAIAKYINSGGTFEEAFRLLAEAKRMSGEGQGRVAANSSQRTSAQTRQPIPGEAIRAVSAQPLVHDASASSGKLVEGGEAISSVPNGHDKTASPPSFNRGQEGQEPCVQTDLRRLAVPVREPTQQQRLASANVAKVAAITIMDTLKIDGLSIGEWSVARARVEGRRKTRDGYILREAVRVVANAPDTAKLRHVLKIEEIQRIRQKAEEVADAV